MQIRATHPTVADYCRQMLNREIVVNKDYQRSNKVWPTAAKSFLIETILLEYPMPKLALHQKTSTRTRRTVNEIIDGQQRSQAILEFYENKLRLSPRLSLREAAGRRYEQLSEELQSAFLGYGIPVDLYVAATDDQIREMFRRINSYSVPLNAEEKRHATFQGPFKWFIHRLSSENDELLISMGVLSERQIFRMADAKFFTELSIALARGIRTSSPRELDQFYKERDEDFVEEDDFSSRITSGLEFVASLPEIHKTAIMKPFQLYSLLLAVMHYQDAVPALSAAVPPSDTSLEREDILANLAALADVAELGEDYYEEVDEDGEQDDGEVEVAVEEEVEVEVEPYFAEFIDASSSGTNTATSRTVRFKYYYDALTARR